MFSSPLNQYLAYLDIHYGWVMAFLAFFDNAILTCHERRSTIDVMRASEGEHAFQTIALALLDWAPMIDDFKRMMLLLFVILYPYGRLL